MSGDRQLLGELALAEHLDVDRELPDEAARLQRLASLPRPRRSDRRGRRRSRAACASGTDRSASRPRRCSAELAEAHVDRHLAAFEPGRHLVRPGARLLALDAAARVAALARAEAAADPLARLARLGGLEIGQVQLVRGHSLVLPIDAHEVVTWRSIPRSSAESVCSLLRPIFPSPSARRVPMCRSDWPIVLRICVILTEVTPHSPRWPRSRLWTLASGSSQTPARRWLRPRLALGQRRFLSCPSRRAGIGITSAIVLPRSWATSSGRTSLRSPRPSRASC